MAPFCCHLQIAEALALLLTQRLDSTVSVLFFFFSTTAATSAAALSTEVITQREARECVLMSTDCDELHWNGHWQFRIEKRVELLGRNEERHGHSTDRQCGDMSAWQQEANILQSLKMEKERQEVIKALSWTYTVNTQLCATESWIIFTVSKLTQSN